jgi:hypothetical protein
MIYNVIGEPPQVLQITLNYNSNRARYKDFLGVWELTSISFGGLFFEFFIPSTLGAHNFFNSIM